MDFLIIQIKQSDFTVVFVVMNFGQIIKSKKIQIVFTIAGAAGGFLYWRFVGCTSGTCAIKSVWYWSTLWGAAFGFLVGELISDIITKRKQSKEERDQ